MVVRVCLECDVHCRSSKNMTSGLSLHAKEDIKPINTSLNLCTLSTASSTGTSGCGPVCEILNVSQYTKVSQSSQ